MAQMPVYLFTGPEAGEKNEAILQLRIAARKKAGVLDEYTFYASETKFSQIITLLLNESLFASGRFVVVQGAEQLKKKEDLEMLSSWITASIDGTSILVLVSDEVSCDKKLESLIPKSNKQIFWEMFDNRKEQWLVNYFKKNGYSISADAIDLVLEMIENNTEALKAECSRFFLCFQPGHQITVEDVERILAHNREESAFTLFDALCTTGRSPAVRLETALGILQKLRLSKDSSGVQLIAGLTYCFRRLLAWHQLMRETTSPSDLDYKIRGFSSKKARTQYQNAGCLWSSLQTSRILALLASSDMEIRSGGAALEDTILQGMLYAITFKEGQPLIQYEDFPC
ncbi:MAG: DNA polymerase III subunit delta [Spirochaetaceae bacterium]|nr:DNA polymerase III subunit delta [Spirochaetaceae bacterium]MBR2462305.1 DNA polymerase III subunit delta [Spirochaetaceae bacterium]